MNIELIRLWQRRRQMWLFTSTIAAMVLFQPIRAHTTTSADNHHHHNNNNMDRFCIEFCFGIDDTTEQYRSDCVCPTRNALENGQQLYRQKHRRQDEDEPIDDFSPTDGPLDGEDEGGGDGNFPIPAPTATSPLDPTISPRPSVAPVADDGEPSIMSLRPSITPIDQPTVAQSIVPSITQQPTISPKPATMMPQPEETPTKSSQTPTMIPIQSDMMTKSPTDAPIFSSARTPYPTNPLESEFPTVRPTTNDIATPSPNMEIDSQANTSTEDKEEGGSGGMGNFRIVLVVGLVMGLLGMFLYVTLQRRLKNSYRGGSYSSTNGMTLNGAETELRLWQSDRHDDNDDRLL